MFNRMTQGTIWALTVLIMLGIGQPAFAGKTRIDTSLAGGRYNDVMNQYVAGATKVELVEKKKKTYLFVEVELYGTVRNAPSYDNAAYFRFLRSEADAYIALIDKFLEWEALARSRRDQLTKEIGKHKDAKGKVRFLFHSGNADRHYLELAFCGFGTCLEEDAAYFDPTNARVLRSLLEQLRDGELKSLDVDSVYK